MNKSAVVGPGLDITPIDIHIGESEEYVILGFDKSVSILEMTPTIAIRVAEKIKEKAVGILRSEPTHDEKTVDDESHFH